MSKIQIKMNLYRSDFIFQHCFHSTMFYLYLGGGGVSVWRNTYQIPMNKKVLLCERKRHTACCVASARSAALWVPNSVLMWEYAIRS